MKSQRQRRHKLAINISLQEIDANRKGGLIIEGGVMSSEYDMCTVYTVHWS